MAVTKLTGLGESTDKFYLNDFDFYIQNTSATGGYLSTDWALVGFTSPEKELDRGIEKFVREAKIPRVSVYKKTIRKKFIVNFSLDQFDKGLVALLTNATLNGNRLAHGTDEPSTEYRAVRFASTLEDGTVWSITVPKAEMTINGAQTVGGEENSQIPVTIEAIYNPSADGTASLYYELYQTAGVSATADVPPAYT
jgi:hypothetical protein